MNNASIYLTESDKLILKFVKEKLIPIAKELRVLALECASTKIGFWETFTHTELKKIESKCQVKSKKFLDYYKKWSDPTEFFESLKPKNGEERQIIMRSYINMKAAVEEYLKECFRMISYIQTYITTQSTSLYNRLAITLSLLAITTSIILAIIF